MKSNFKVGDKLKCIDPKVLHGYYDTVPIKDEILIIYKFDVPYVTKMPKSQTFVILDAAGKSKKGHLRRFSVSTHEFNNKFFKLVP